MNPTTPIEPLNSVSVVSHRFEAGNFRLPSAQHHRIMIHASKATRSFCNDVGRYFERRNGDIDLVPAGDEAGFETESPFEALEVRLATSVVERASKLGQRMNARQFETRHLLRDERIEHLVRALDINGNSVSPAGAFFVDSVAMSLAIRLLGLNDAEQEGPARLSNTQLRHVFEYIDAHLHEPLTLDVLSRIAGASSSHLRTWFKALTGSTVHRYVILRRVERARSLLMQGHLSTDEIAHQTGFAHQSHLAHWVRRETGQTPRSLRRSHLPT